MRNRLIVLSTALLIGCSTSPQPPTTPVQQEATGCSPQLLSVSEEQGGTLEIQLVDQNDAPVAGQTVIATRMVYTGTKCASRISGTSDAQGVIKFDRLKTGPYAIVMQGQMTGTFQTEVKENQTAFLTLVRAILSSPSPSPGI